MIRLTSWCGLVSLAVLCPLVQAQSLSRADGSTEARTFVEVDHGPVVRSLNGASVLTHSVSEIPVDFNSALCDEDGTGYHTENSYYRRFNLPDFEVGGDLAIDSVLIAVENAEAGTDGAQPLNLSFHTLTGEFVEANLTSLGQVSAFVEDTTLAPFIVALADGDVAVPAESELVVEVNVPDGRENGYRFTIGSNPDGETDSTYMRAPECNVNEPTPVAEAGDGFPDMHLIMTVFGHTTVIATEPGAGERRLVVLGQSYPNPATVDLATIPFELNAPSDVQIAVYDALGRRVALLVDTSYAGGRHAVTFDTSGLPGGTYTYRIVANGDVEARRLVVVR